jgi:hypothetical protein
MWAKARTNVKRAHFCAPSLIPVKISANGESLETIRRSRAADFRAHSRIGDGRHRQ